MNGECSRCGTCCQHIIFGVAHGGAGWEDYYFRRGCEIIPGVGLLVPSRCPELREQYTDGKLEFTCNIYTTRPRLCRNDYTDQDGKPRPPYRFPGCTAL